MATSAQLCALVADIVFCAAKSPVTSGMSVSGKRPSELDGYDFLRTGAGLLQLGADEVGEASPNGRASIEMKPHHDAGGF